VRLGQRVSEEQKKTAAAGEPTAPGTELLSDEDLGNLDEQLNAELVSVAERLAAIARG
jgi:hypothetical protein